MYFKRATVAILLVYQSTDRTQLNRPTICNRQFPIPTVQLMFDGSRCYTIRYELEIVLNIELKLCVGIRPTYHWVRLCCIGRGTEWIRWIVLEHSANDVKRRIKTSNEEKSKRSWVKVDFRMGKISQQKPRRCELLNLWVSLTMLRGDTFKIDSADIIINAFKPHQRRGKSYKILELSRWYTHTQKDCCCT